MLSTVFTNGLFIYPREEIHAAVEDLLSVGFHDVLLGTLVACGVIRNEIREE